MWPESPHPVARVTTPPRKLNPRLVNAPRPDPNYREGVARGDELTTLLERVRDDRALEPPQTTEVIEPDGVLLSAWAERLSAPHDEPRRVTLVARLGGLMAVVTMIAYSTWRALATLPHHGLDRGVGIALLTFETVPLLPIVIRLVTLWTLDNPRPPRAGKDETFGSAVVFIPTLNEPREILVPTIVAACALEPAHETWVLDDGNRPWLREFCQRYGARYVTRPDNSNAKAGNINHALDLLRTEDNPAEFIAILDCDHVPLPGFLYETLGWFDKPEVALVQAPQAYYNSDSFDSDGVAGDQGIFWHVLMVARDSRRSDPFWCGSTSVIRRAALESVGGVAVETVTEDLHTTLKLLRDGWRSVYHHQILAVGLAPETPDHYLVQRRRWALGAMQILVKERLWWPKRWLTWRNYLEYLWSVIWWFEGFVTVCAMMLPAAILLGGIQAARVNFDVYACAFVGSTAIRFVGANMLYRGYIRWRHALELRMMRVQIGVSCVAWLFRRRQLAFEVTPKGGDGDRHQSRVPSILSSMAVALGVVIAYGTVTLVMPLPWPSSHLATLTAGVWLVYGEVVLLLGMARVRSGRYAASRRIAHRFPARTTLTIDGLPASLNDISLSGLSATFEGSVPDDPMCVVRLPGARGITMHRVSQRGQVVRYKVADADYDGIRQLALWVFHTPPGALPGVRAGVPVAAVLPPPDAPDKSDAVQRTGKHAATPKRMDVQGLRAIAVLLVIASHLGISALGGGFVGVDIFFVISGFMIMTQMLRENRLRGSISLKAFYARRALRILPAALVTTLGILAYGAYTGSPLLMREIAADARWSTLFGENLHLIRVATDYFADQTASPFQHFWSLSVEEQFYLLWPVIGILLLRATSHRQLTRILLAGLVLGVVVATAMTHSNPSGAYFNLACRAYELGIGIVVAYMAIRWEYRPAWFVRLAGLAGGVLGLALVGYSAVRMSEDGFPSWHGLIPTVGAALIIAAGVTRQTGVNLLLGWRPLAWIGDISYSLYLWHWPVIVFGGERIPASWAWYERDALLAGVSFALATASYYLIERPFLRRSRTTFRGWRPMVLWPVAVVATFSVALGSIAVSDLIFKHRAANAATWYAGHAALCDGISVADDETALGQLRNELACAQKLHQNGAPLPADLDPSKLDADDWLQDACWDVSHPGERPCLDPAHPSFTIVTYGDSHMGDWMPAIYDLAKRWNAKLVPFVMPGCTPYDITGSRNWNDDVLPQDCVAFKQKAPAEIAALHPDLLIVGGIADLGMPYGNSPYGASFRDAFTSAVPKLASLAPQVVILGDTVQRRLDGGQGDAWNTADCISQPGVDMASCDYDLPYAQHQTTAEMGKIAAASNVPVVDTLPLLCLDDWCPAVVGSRAVLSDDDHVSEAWSRHVEDALGELLKPYLPTTSSP